MLKPIRFVPAGTRIAFVAKRRLAFIFSILLVIGSLAALIGQGLNFGIDFKGGILMEVRTSGPADVASIRSTLSVLKLGEVNIQEFGGETDVLIRIQEQAGGETERLVAIEAVKTALGAEVEYRRTEFVGPTVGKELITAGMWAVGLALMSIMLYIWFRFEWQFGVGAIIALSHDILSAMGMFALLQYEFNLATVAAVLTIAGYSINDTVVVFDRVRENLRKYKRMDLADVFNMSINQTLSRTTMTSVTTLLALLAIFCFGGEILADFALAMIWGVCIGTYSSIFIAVPVLLYVNLKRNDEDPMGVSVPPSERIEDG